ncbi:MAG TPA: hypothetical protein DCY12_12010 [Candidatus Atribacteria bacterium]|nr:hypothetical protein [Candidatus Atribacteria bacterium]
MPPVVFIDGVKKARVKFQLILNSKNDLR